MNYLVLFSIIHDFNNLAETCGHHQCNPLLFRARSQMDFFSTHDWQGSRVTEAAASPKSTGEQKPRRGRKAGVPNRASAARERELAASGLTPLEFMIACMRNEANDPAMRLDAAAKAAPYVHPRLAQTQLTGKDGGPIQIEDKTKSDLLSQIFTALQGKT